MKILYGVQGTGNGHVSRSRMMAHHLNALGVDVTWLFSGRRREDYFDMEIFGDFLCRRGFTFVTRDGNVQVLQTALENRIGECLGDIRALDLSPYDLIITDYEPISAWAGRFQRKRVLGIGHQYAFLHRVPLEGDDMVSRLLLRRFAPADIALGLHWSSFGHPILPPIVHPDLTRHPDSPANKILVYLPFENQQAVTQLLQQLPGFRFHQYASELTDGSEGNVELRKACYEGFRNDLMSSAGVICNAGFELVSESIHLGLRVLVKPLHGQAEQLSNARALVELGLGERMESLDIATMGAWLNSLKSRPLQRSGVYPDVARAIVDWIIAGDYQAPQQLATALWSRVQSDIPLTVRESVPAGVRATA